LILSLLSQHNTHTHTPHTHTPTLTQTWQAKVAALPAGDFNLPVSHLSLRVAGVDYDGGEVVSHVMRGGDLTLSPIHVSKWMPRLVDGCDRLEKLLSSL